MLPTIDAPELFIGICSPLGTDNRKVVSLLQAGLKAFDYASDIVKVTKLMKDVIIPGIELAEKPYEERYDSHIKYANGIRAVCEEPSALALLCCARIRSLRRLATGNPAQYVKHRAYIFDQFKRPEEIIALRQIYGRLFISVSVYSDKAKRTQKIEGDISRDHGQARATDEVNAIARSLIARDENEDRVPTGQRMRDAFALADLFIDIDDTESSERIIKRFLSSLFGSNITSPTIDEYAMYSAKSASLRSTDLSRQVGAAVFTCDGEILAMGSNEVPKAGGGTYWTGDDDDARDFRLGHDENDRIKRALLVDVVQRLRGAELLSDEKKDEELVEYILAETERRGSPLRESRIMDIIEFGRIIHAEMSAICDAARLGRPVKGAWLFCTTFPCHICAKHIVACGIDRVVYIEPYPKSYVDHLHHDSISIGTDPVEKKVLFSPFIGISPFRYRELFERAKRKDSSGNLEEWIASPPKPNIAYTVAVYITNEQAACNTLKETLDDLVAEGRVAFAPQHDFHDLDKPEVIADPEPANDDKVTLSLTSG